MDKAADTPKKHFVIYDGAGINGRIVFVQMKIWEYQMSYYSGSLLVIICRFAIYPGLTVLIGFIFMVTGNFNLLPSFFLGKRFVGREAAIGYKAHSYF